MRREVTRTRVAQLVAEATDGRIRVEDALTGDASLAVLGLGSLAMLRLLDAVEDEFGTEIDINRCRPPDSVDQLVDELTRHGTDPRPTEPARGEPGGPALDGG